MKRVPICSGMGAANLIFLGLYRFQISDYQRAKDPGADPGFGVGGAEMGFGGFSARPPRNTPSFQRLIAIENRQLKQGNVRGLG